MRSLFLIWGGFLLGATLAWAQDQDEAISVTGDGWVLIQSVSYDNAPAGWGTEDSDFALLWRTRVGAKGDFDRFNYKFQFSNASISDLYGTRFGSGGPSVTVEHAYLSYDVGPNLILYLGRVPIWWLENDLVFDTGRKRGNDTAQDGAYLAFTLSELTSAQLAWIRLREGGPGSNDNDAFYLQLKQNFSEVFWGIIGGTSITCDASGCNPAGENYTAAFAKLGYAFTPEFDFWFNFLSSNGQINGAPEVAGSDTAAFQVGANYRASDLVKISGEFASLGGSSVPAFGSPLLSTAFIGNDYVARNLVYYSAPSGDTDITYFNFRIDYTLGENAALNLDFTNAAEEDVTPSNTGNGFLVTYSLKFK